jgi:hypothetical protein
MSKMGRYCKAYPVSRFRESGLWNEDSQHARSEKGEIEGVETQAPRELTDDDHLYLQEDFTVTDGIFLEENVIFSEVTPEWKTFCVEGLKFEVPPSETVN